MTNLEKLQTATRLIEEMTDCRFAPGISRAYIQPDRKAYLAINMVTDLDFEAGLYRVHFTANINRMGKPMNVDELSELLDEVSRTHALGSVKRTVLLPSSLEMRFDLVGEKDG